MKRLVIISTLLITGAVRAYSQTDSSHGIDFLSNISWQEVLQKAKAEHKYIFVDCYTTWCGPCKVMEREIYPLKDVGDVYNNQFISIKLQMDRTPVDNDTIKKWYRVAKMMVDSYTVKAYPTFLFFDPEGEPVHKAVGTRDANGFIQLAADAQNHHKQYYSILKDFQPGRLDTADEKGLARSFTYTDSELGGKLAADYLKRIPKLQMALADNLQLISQFKSNQIVMAMAMAYIHKLSDKELDEDKNLLFLIWFGNNSEVRKIAQAHVNRLPEQGFYREAMLNFLSVFTATPQDRGFRFLFKTTAEIDSIMKNPDWAQAKIGDVIFNTELLPVLKAGRNNGDQPDFDSVANAISMQYGAYYSDRVTQDGKAKWYSYLVHEKKLTEYWPQLIQADIDREKRIWEFSRLQYGGNILEMNNFCYSDIFQHSDDSIVIQLGIKWMSEVVRIDSNYACLDTYACLLYKSGKVEEALKIEEKALQCCIENKKRGTYSSMMHTTLAIQRMWKNEKIWQEKEFQD
jgi:thioredoxin-related protein